MVCISICPKLSSNLFPFCLGRVRAGQILSEAGRLGSGLAQIVWSWTIGGTNRLELDDWAELTCPLENGNTVDAGQNMAHYNVDAGQKTAIIMWTQNILMFNRPGVAGAVL